ncbi:hypothetical protein EMCG_05493 [[Emmonsia] crescens]|uniref:Uncharacterized protein n=1 Tax=[Emmonsia] crescens TaxID=73230 RepID=A0A0G2J610_9EURO|nr:hypothetical protein EMCG_05493 [Emmonsia crescens UAMH 3008]
MTNFAAITAILDGAYMSFQVTHWWRDGMEGALVIAIPTVLSATLSTAMEAENAENAEEDKESIKPKKWEDDVKATS